MDLSVPVLIFWTALAADTASSVNMLNRGCQEANPVVATIGLTTPVRITVGSGLYGIGVTWTWGKAKAQEPKLATGLLLATAGAHLWAAHHNYRLRCP